MTLTTSSQTTELACGTRVAAAACVEVLREVVAELDPDVLLAEEAPEVWALFDQGEKLCAAAKTLVARRVEESGVWREAGMRSAAEYLALRGGTTRDAARDGLKTSERLRDLPQVEDAMRRGELSGSQAHVIADAASHDPMAQPGLLDQAKVGSFKELRDECLRRKAAADPKPQDTRDRIYKERCFRLSTDPEGAWRFSGRGPLDHAGVFGATLNPLIDDEFQKARADGRREERATLAYDALQEMARLARGAIYGYDPGPTSSDDETADAERQGREHSDTIGQANDAAGRAGPGGAQRGVPSNKTRPKTLKLARRPNPSHLGLLRVDLTALRRGYTMNGETCEVANSGPVSVTVARELLRQAVIKLIITRQGRVVSVTHIGNGIPAAERLGARPPGPPPEDPQPPPTHVALVHMDSRNLDPPVGHLAAEPSAGPDQATPISGTRAVQAARRRALRGDEACTLPGVGRIPVAAARRLLGPSLLNLAAARGVAVAGYVHKGRKATVAQRAALLWIQPECMVEGCPHSFVQIDHRADWAKTYVTRLEALDRLCGHHHALKTHQNWALVAGTGKRPMVPPSDPRHPTYSHSAKRNTQSPPSTA